MIFALGQMQHQEVAQSIGVPCSCVIPLLDGLRKVIADGLDALMNNPLAEDDARSALDECSGCVSKYMLSHRDLWCIDGDLWSAEKDGEIFGENEEKPSVDLLVMAQQHDGCCMYMVEGKLGVAAKAKRPRHPTPQDLGDKFLWTKMRIGGRIPVSNEMYVLFSKSVIEKMRNRIANYNRANRNMVLVGSCIDECLMSGEGCSR